MIMFFRIAFIELKSMRRESSYWRSSSFVLPSKMDHSGVDIQKNKEDYITIKNGSL